MKVFVSMTLLLTLTTPLFSQGNKSPTLKGIVTDENGAALRATYVFLRDYQSGTKWEMQTEGDGGFSFTVDPGCYDIFVSSGVFLPFSKRICVQAEGNSFRIRLHADPHPRLRLE